MSDTEEERERQAESQEEKVRVEEEGKKERKGAAGAAATCEWNGRSACACRYGTHVVLTPHTLPLPMYSLLFAGPGRRPATRPPHCVDLLSAALVPQHPVREAGLSPTEQERC